MQPDHGGHHAAEAHEISMRADPDRQRRVLADRDGGLVSKVAEPPGTASEERSSGHEQSCNEQERRGVDQTTIAQTGISGGQQAIAYAVFGVIGTIGVGTPVVLHLALGKRAQPKLDGIKRWMARNNEAIISVLGLVFGVKLIGNAISGLSG